LYKFPITNSVSIQPEISYTTKGAELSYNNTNGNTTFKTNYIEVPVLLRFNPDAFNVHVGPYAAYMVAVNNKRFQPVYL
jgi:hypothetical protein